MQYFSTRDSELRVSAQEAIVRGLAPQSGLFVPEAFPKADLEGWKNLSYPELAEKVLAGFLTDYSADFLHNATAATYGAAFDGKAGRTVKVRENLYSLELWHGPTCAFKDYALQLMPKLLVEAKKMLGGLSFMLRGLPFLYQGQELGMANCAFPSIEAIDDVSSRDEYQRCLKVGLNEEEALKVVSHYSRDNGRTPFQWNDEKNGGFTTGTPWLMVNPQYKEINAASQIGREGSIYEFYKSMIALRRDDRYEDTIVYGVTEPVLEDQKDIMAYFRRGEKQDILVIGNFRDEAAEVEILELKGGSLCVH